MTLKQKQALLAYLGYYDGPLDGLWGEKSQRATPLTSSATTWRRRMWTASSGQPQKSGFWSNRHRGAASC